MWFIGQVRMVPTLSMLRSGSLKKVGDEKMSTFTKVRLFCASIVFS